MEKKVRGTSTSMVPLERSSLVQALATKVICGRRGVLVLGQEQDSDGGRFDHNQAYEGRLNRLNVYDKYMSLEECNSLSEAGREGNVVSWKDIIAAAESATKTIGQISMKEDTDGRLIIEKSTSIDPRSITGVNAIQLGQHGQEGAGAVPDSHITLSHQEAPGTKFQLTSVDLVNGNNVCSGIVIQRKNDDTGVFTDVFSKTDLGKSGSTIKLGGIHGFADALPSTEWRIKPVGVAESDDKFCSIAKLNLYGAITDKSAPSWHGDFSTGLGLDELFNKCAAMGEACAGVVRETETSQKRGALVARWATNEENEQLPTTVVDKAYVLGSIDESGEIVTSYDYDVEQRGLGLRLGDCNMGVFESDIELPYVADWSFLLTTKHDASSGADSSDYMDFYIRQDGDEEYIFLSRHMNDADKSTPVRLPTSTRFGLKVVAQSSNAAMPNHMRIQTGPIGTSERPGDLALVYSITGPDCIEHLTEETSSDKDTKAVHNGRGNVHAAYCALALFQIDRYTGQLAVRTANVLDVGIQSTYPVEVTATDPTGLTANCTF